jgi:citrate synthase
MTLQDLEQKLVAKFGPGAEVVAVLQSGLQIKLIANGRVYFYRGTNIRIAEELKLVELWYIYRDGQVCGSAHSAEEANGLANSMEIEHEKLSEAWGVSPSAIYSIGKVN